MLENKTCPFCGSDELELIWPHDHAKREYAHAAQCKKCKAQGPLVSYGPTATIKEIEACKAKAIELWNKRGASDGN